MKIVKIALLAAVYHTACGVGRAAGALAAFVGKETQIAFNRKEIDEAKVEQVDAEFDDLTTKWGVN